MGGSGSEMVRDSRRHASVGVSQTNVLAQCRQGLLVAEDLSSTCRLKPMHQDSLFSTHSPSSEFEAQ